MISFTICKALGLPLPSGALHADLCLERLDDSTGRGAIAFQPWQPRARCRKQTPATNNTAPRRRSSVETLWQLISPLAGLTARLHGATG